MGKLGILYFDLDRSGSIKNGKGKYLYCDLERSYSLRKGKGRCLFCDIDRGESIKNQPNLFLGEIDLFFCDVIAL